jgi:hypothetical protein
VSATRVLAAVSFGNLIAMKLEILTDTETHGGLVIDD